MAHSDRFISIMKMNAVNGWMDDHGASTKSKASTASEVADESTKELEKPRVCIDEFDADIDKKNERGGKRED